MAQMSRRVYRSHERNDPDDPGGCTDGHEDESVTSPLNKPPDHVYGRSASESKTDNIEVRREVQGGGKDGVRDGSGDGATNGVSGDPHRLMLKSLAKNGNWSATCASH